MSEIMNRYFIIIIGLLFSACCDIYQKTTYNYNGITIDRVDECGKTSFYYKNGSEKEKIIVEYSGINDGFKGYLKFENGGKVLLLSGDGYFKAENSDTSRFVYRRILAHQRPEIRDNVCYVQLSTRYEKQENNNSETKVEVVYHNHN